jgi:VanZ family protein
MQILKLTKILTWLWLLAILYLSLKPQVEMPISFEYMDKLLHLGSYAFAMILITLAYPQINRYRSVALLFTYSLLIEIAQLFAINRYFEVADLVANLIGILLAIYLMKFTRATAQS